MDKKIIKFDDTEIEEYEFDQYKRTISISDIDINKIVVSVVYNMRLLGYFHPLGYFLSGSIRTF